MTERERQRHIASEDAELQLAQEMGILTAPRPPRGRPLPERPECPWSDWQDDGGEGGGA